MRAPSPSRQQTKLFVGVWSPEIQQECDADAQSDEEQLVNAGAPVL